MIGAQEILQSGEFTLLIAFLAGVLISVEPCALTLDASIVGYVAGIGLNFKKGFLAGTLFIVGRSFTYALFGALSAFIGFYLQSILRTFLYPLVGVVLILAGLWFLKIINFNYAFCTSKIERLVKKLTDKGFLGALLLGVLFGLIIYPCSTPVLIGILALASTKTTALQGGLLLLVYGFGLGLPIPFITGAIGKTNVMLKTRGHAVFERFGGILLISLGLYLIIPLLIG